MSANIICSGALFYTLDTQRFLFLHRVQSKQNNVWGLVGGTNESEEIPFQDPQTLFCLLCTLCKNKNLCVSNV
jgi:hypothetical protein